MKKIILPALLTLALLTPWISKAQYTIPNESFESWVSGSSAQPNNWKIFSGSVGKIPGVQYTQTINGQSSSVYRPCNDGATAIQFLNQQQGSTLYIAGIEDSFSFSGKPAYFALNYAYFPGTTTDEFALAILMTGHNPTTHRKDTILLARGTGAPGVFAAPWSYASLSLASLYSTKYTENPDTCRILILNTASTSTSMNTSLILDEIYFSDAVPAGVMPLGAPASLSGTTTVYPNPFTGQTNIEYQLASAGQVVLNVYDISGKLVTNLVNENQGTGMHQVTFDAMDLKSGVYIYKLQSGDDVQTGKLILNK